MSSSRENFRTRDFKFRIWRGNSTGILASNSRIYCLSVHSLAPALIYLTSLGLRYDSTGSMTLRVYLYEFCSEIDRQKSGLSSNAPLETDPP